MFRNIILLVTNAMSAYLLLLFASRFLSRKTITSMTVLDFAVGITIGSVVGGYALKKAGNFMELAVVLFTIILTAIAVDYFHLKSIRFSKLVYSEPVVVIKNGEIVESNMKKLRMNIPDLMKNLRKQGNFNIADVEFAIMEVSGDLSVLNKSQKQPLTPSDLKIPTKYTGLTKDLIIDGKIMEENLIDINLDEDWLKKQLVANGLSSEAEVLYAGLDTAGSIYISKKNKSIEKHGKYGIE